VNSHPVTFEDLIDWLDGRLPPEALHRVEEHLAAGCAACQRDVAWLRRFQGAVRAGELAQPPAALIARAKASFGARQRARLPRRGWAPWPRLAPGLAALIVLLALTAYLTLVPTAFAHGAVVALASAPAEARRGEDGAWQPLAVGSRLQEGDWVRARGSTAVVSLFDGSTLELQPEAEVSFTSLRSGLFGIVRRVALYQPAGTVSYTVPPLSGSLAAFAVTSPMAQVSVRGTRFVVTATASQTQVEVLEGTVMVAGALDSGAVQAGEGAIAAAGARLRIGPRALPTPTATPGRGPQPTSGPALSPGPGPGRPEGGSPTPQPARPGPSTPRPGGTPQASPTPGPGDANSPGPTRTPGPGSGQGPTAPGPHGQGSG